MTNNYVKLTNSTLSIDKKLLVYSLNYNWSNQVADFPIPGNLTTIQSVQFNGWKNPGYNIRFTIPLVDNPSGFITWEEWNKIVRTTSTTLLSIQVSSSETLIARDRKSTRLNSSHVSESRMPSSA